MEENNKTKNKSKKKRLNYLRTFIAVLIVALIAFTGMFVGYIVSAVRAVPDQIDDLRPAAASQFFDIDGNLISTTKSEEQRIPVKINRIPLHLQNAFIAIEDIRFYEHRGVDPKAILRAFINNITNSAISEGGSTITQQLAKNAVLTQEQTLKRKIQEAFIAMQIENKYSKSEILEMYLNQIYFGQGAYGIQSAAQIYFGKNVDDLTIAQSAMLAGIPKSPNYYSPLNNLDAAKNRQELVIDQMLKYELITPQEAAAAKEEKIDVTSHRKKYSKKLDYVIDYITQIVIEKFGANAVYKEGLKIYTTIDMKMQSAAEAAMSDLPVYFSDSKGLQQPQGALVAIDPRNGYIKAMVGGRGDDKFNRAVLAVRQPGSAFKPFVYLAAIDSGLTPATIIEDKAFSQGSWNPQNYDRRYHGKMSLRTALMKSYNIPVVLLAQEVTPEKVIDFAQKMGISTLETSGRVNDRNLAMALGGLTKGVTPLEMASAYGVLANNGVYTEPIVILKIVDRSNKTIFTANPTTRQAVSASSAYITTDMMQDVIRQGTGYAANIGRPAAGKTGTTDSHKDAWFVGFTPDLSTALWIGNDEGGNLRGMTGGNLPAQLWKKFMSSALAGSPALSFSRPPGVIIPPEPSVNQETDPLEDDLKQPGSTPPIEKPPANPDNKQTNTNKKSSDDKVKDSKKDNKKDTKKDTKIDEEEKAKASRRRAS